MASVVFHSGACVGHQELYSSGYTFSSLSVSGTIPTAGKYTIDSAVVTFYNDSYWPVRQSGTGTKAVCGGTTIMDSGVWVGAGGGSISLSMSTPSNLIELLNSNRSVKITGGWQMYGGTYIDITVTYTSSNVASTMTANKESIEAGQSITWTISPSNASYVHIIVPQIGTKKDDSIGLGAGVTSSTWTLPYDWLTQMPNAESATLTVALQTYTGSMELIGSNYYYYKMVCPASVKPIVGSVSVAPSGEVVVKSTSGSAVYVQNKTSVTLSLSGIQTQYGSTIASWGCVFDDGGSLSSTSISSTLTYTSPVFTSSGTKYYQYWVTDKRGRSATGSGSIKVLAYAMPSITSMSGYRIDASGNADPLGTYGVLTYGVTQTAMSGTDYFCGSKYSLTVKNGSTVLSTQTTGLSSGQKLLDNNGNPLTLEQTKDYKVTLTIWDSYGSYSRSYTISTVEAALSFNSTFDGVGIGVLANKEKTLEIADNWKIVQGSKRLDLTGIDLLWSGSWQSGSITLSEDPTAYTLLLFMVRWGREATAVQASASTYTVTYTTVDSDMVRQYYCNMSRTDSTLTINRAALFGNGSLSGSIDTTFKYPITQIYGLR